MELDRHGLDKHSPVMDGAQKLFDQVLTVTDRATKQVILITCEATMKAPAVATSSYTRWYVTVDFRQV